MRDESGVNRLQLGIAAGAGEVARVKDLVADLEVADIAANFDHRSRRVPTENARWFMHRFAK